MDLAVATANAHVAVAADVPTNVAAVASVDTADGAAACTYYSVATAANVEPVLLLMLLMPLLLRLFLCCCVRCCVCCS